MNEDGQQALGMAILISLALIAGSCILIMALG